MLTVIARTKCWLSRVALCLILSLFSQGIATAQYSSTNYSVNEVFFGVGGELDGTSTSYRARASLGDLGVGYSESSVYAAFAGFTTTTDEYLEVYVNSGVIDLGTLSESSTASGSGSFYVRSYLSSGYVVQSIGTGLTDSSGGSISNMGSNGPANPGVEQFGMNLVANTAPAVGADPVQVPDSTFSFGTAAVNYDTPDSFRYLDGDTIASSSSSTGQTNYTVSYIVDINEATTTAGFYIFDQIFVVTPTF